jgi:hypothetical protein
MDIDHSEDNELEVMKGELVEVLGKKLLEKVYELVACNVFI